MPAGNTDTIVAAAGTDPRTATTGYSYLFQAVSQAKWRERGTSTVRSTNQKTRIVASNDPARARGGSFIGGIEGTQNAHTSHTLLINVMHRVQGYAAAGGLKGPS